MQTAIYDGEKLRQTSNLIDVSLGNLLMNPLYRETGQTSYWEGEVATLGESPGAGIQVGGATLHPAFVTSHSDRDGGDVMTT